MLNAFRGHVVPAAVQGRKTLPQGSNYSSAMPRPANAEYMKRIILDCLGGGADGLRMRVDVCGHDGVPRGCWLWDVDLAHAGGSGALSDVGRQQPERVLLTRGVDRPPDRMAAGVAGGDRRSMTQRALVPLERREHDAALVRLVAMLQEVMEHPSRLLPRRCTDIGRTP